MLTFFGLYDPYRGLEQEPLPTMPPVSHMELGRQEALGFSFSDRPEPPVTVESLAVTMAKLLNELGPPPVRAPWQDPDYVLIMKPAEVGRTDQLTVYWRAGR